MVPQRLVANFTKNRVLLCIVLALGLHALVIAGTSVDYIYYNMINQEAGRARVALREKEQEERKEAERREQLKKVEAVRAARATKASASNASTKDDSKLSHDELMAKHKDAPVVKRVTEVASPDEIPDAPDDLNISLEDTSI